MEHFDFFTFVAQQYIESIWVIINVAQITGNHTFYFQGI